MIKKKLLLMLFAIVTLVSACSDDLLTLLQNSDNETVALPKVTVWFDTQQESIKNWYQTINAGSAIAKPNDLYMEGYTFLGWYNSNVNGTLWDFSKPVIEDMTLYAMWQQNNGTTTPENPVIYTVTYDNGGMGNYVSSIELKSGTTLYDSHLPTLTAENYIFQGWYYNDVKVVAGQFKVTSNITLTAKWLVIDTTDTTPPADVTDLKVSLENNKPSLSWINPKDDDFNTVIITYNKDGSTTSFGINASSGAGNKDGYTDTKALSNASLYTFTVQTVDYSGNVSKGVSTKLDGSTVNPEPEPEPEPEPTPEPEPEPEPDYAKYKNQTVWFYGIKGPMPDDDAWIRPSEAENYKVWELPWKEEYGWYDVNKTHLVDKETDNTIIAKDNELCWAATSSNILHWWLRLNDKYIKEYDKLNPDKAKKRPTNAYPLKGTQYGSQYQESEIFQYYIDHFDDEAGWGDAGVNWFISGYQITVPDMIVSGGGGFFEDVFPKGKYLATYAQGLSKERFTEVIIDAIENHKALGVSRQAGSSHLMTLWGAEFDEEGYVKAVYLADNNVEQTTKPYTKNLTRRLIKYTTLPGTTATTAEMSAFWTTSYSPVVSLVIVDLGVKYWEEYLQQHGVTVK